MPKHQHEIRDPIHNFVRVTADEVAAINSRPFQRLRHIHQLALTYLVYPGATHRRFEHSLGVMELAGRVFDILTHERNRRPDVDLFPDSETLLAWRKVVRLAALFHDVGHLPFSHAAEEQLLPDGKHHEWLTVEVLRSDEMRQVLKGMMPSPDPDLVAKIAIGPEKWGKWFGKATDFKEWDLLMTEIVTGDAFGVDRMDYLLRDSHHAGVAYGRFDHYRLIDTLRILPHPTLERPMIGIEKGGIHAAEALQLARQFMFLQLYYHHVRIAYDIHLSEFMAAWLKTYPTDVEGHLRMTDNEVLSAIASAAADNAAPGHDPARRIMRREHFRKIYERNALDQRVHPDAVGRVAAALRTHFGDAAVRDRPIPPKPQNIEFPILLDSGEISTSRSESTIYADFKPAAIGFVLIDPEKRKDARTWLAANKKTILSGTDGARRMTMNDLQRSAVVAKLVKEYRARNAFCGETMVQKSVFVLQELLKVPLAFDFQLYIYGPFSFELQRHVSSMMADDMLTMRSLEYGSTFEPGQQVAYLEKHTSNTIVAHREAVDFVVKHLAGRGVKQLERVATALYFTVATDDVSVDDRAAKICEVKPHITADEARKAVEEVDRWRKALAA